MRSQTAEQKLIAAYEREIASLQKANAKLLRMVEMVMEQKFYRPTVTGGVRENEQVPGLPIESLNDVATFDEDADTAQSDEQQARLHAELSVLEREHTNWRATKGLDAKADDTAAA